MVIATRVLRLRGESGDIEIPIRIFAPERIRDGTWSCHYEIDWPDKTWEMSAGGNDAVQALVLALTMIGSEIYTSDYHKSGKLFLDAPGQGYGFPVPVSLRNLLQGSDLKFF